MQTTLRNHFGDSSYDPIIFTYGVPPPFDESTGCPALNADKVFNFMNVQSEIDEIKYEVLGVTVTFDLDNGNEKVHKMDVAIPIGIGMGAAHLGRNVIISDEDSDNCFVVDAAEMEYPIQDYSMKWNSNDVTEMTAHLAGVYQENLKALAAGSGQPMEDGFHEGKPCVSDEQCRDKKCGSDTSGPWFLVADQSLCQGDE